jgi:hypothetical protein
MTERSPSEEGDDPRADDHLEDVQDGAGCTEIWEHLSDRRESEDVAADD